MVEMPIAPQQNDKTASSVEPMLIDARVKTEVVNVEELPLPQCNQKLWHEDGTVIVILSSMLFRVHQATLCDQSSVLKALVVLSQAVPISEEAPTPGEKDLRYIHLDDDPADIEQLLLSLYDAECTAPEQVSFTLVSAWLRMGTKYKVDRLRDDAIRRLAICYPSTLRNFDLANSASFVLPIEAPTVPEAPMVAFLALTHDLPYILPLALYYCCLEQPSSLRSIIDKASQTYGRGITRDDPSLIARCYEGRPALLDLHHKFLFTVFDGALSPECKRPTFCGSALHGLLMHAARIRWFTSPDIFYWHWDAIKSLAACQACEALVRRRYEDLRAQMWMKLPQCFGIELSETEWPIEDTTKASASVPPPTNATRPPSGRDT
ncbi:uncharacterized protein STEHIDRAFT_145373 [Stereum hirsutum FP-91666 SS1]|uniref:uncharacterized protein n=1 Tax=Stereum hirsutum (strain FP-91666) TaxID=721885 RepID=UPI000440B7CB|nr:uncharacterized protein STEHIDRAFT_145373 [Stereum hirsutum FP-91666 SS1]EIM90248.1 hypothetical protein STEHIDRAFT_145373 [Stereum hirsutum FP-91666 SS1]